MVEMTEESMKELGELATKTGYESYSSDRDPGIAFHEEIGREVPGVIEMPARLRSAVMDGFYEGWRHAEAEDLLTDEERAWIVSFADRLGCSTRDLRFDGQIDRGIFQVTLVLEKKAVVEGSRAIPWVTMELRKFDFCPKLQTGWIAFLMEFGSRCFVQGEGDPEGEIPPTPEAAVESLMLHLENLVQTRKDQLSRIKESVK